MRVGLTLVIMTVEFEYVDEEGERFADKCLIKRDRFGGGSVMVWGALCAEGKQISLLCKATSILKVTLTRFCSLKLFLSFKGMGLQY